MIRDDIGNLVWDMFLSLKQYEAIQISCIWIKEEWRMDFEARHVLV